MNWRAELLVAIDVNFLPAEAAAAVQFGEGFFDDLAEVASFARVDDDLPEAGHGLSVAIRGLGLMQDNETTRKRAVPSA